MPRRVVTGGLAVALLAAAPASADAAPRFALDPLGSASASGYFKYRALPGGSIEGRIRVANLGDRAGVARIYAVDATTGATTGAVYRDVRDPRRGVGAWTRLSRTTVRLRADSSSIVRFTTRVPAGIRSGDHLGGIVVEDATATAPKPVSRGKGRFEIRIRRLTIIALKVRVPGTRAPALALTSLGTGGSGGRQALLLGIRNDGNVLVKGHGRLVVTSASGRAVQDDAFPVDTFVPRTAIALPLMVRGRRALGEGHYRGVATVRYAGRTVRRAFGFTVSRKHVAQVFGSAPAPVAPLGAPGGLLPWILAAVGFGMAVLTAATRRRRRPVPAGRVRTREERERDAARRRAQRERRAGA